MEKNIIIIDNDEVIAYLSSCILKDLGYNTLYFTRVMDVIDKANRHPKFFNLIICAQIMNELSGTDLAEELLKINPEIPVILLTGSKKQTSYDEYPNIKDTIVKPVSKEALYKSIKKIFGEENAN